MTEKIHWILVDPISNKIVGVGTSHDAATFAALDLPAGTEIHLFTGGILGHFYIDGVMHQALPEPL